MKKHIYPIIALIGVGSLLSASDVAQTTHTTSAFVLPKRDLSLSLSYIHGSHININETEESINGYSSIDSNYGAELSLAYGIHKHVGLYYNYEENHIHYTQDVLENKHNELFTRVNFYDVPHYSFDDLSLDIGYIHNEADKLTQGLSNLSDDSLYLRLLWGSKLTSSLVNLYTSIKYSDIHTKFNGQSLDRDEKAFSVGISHTVEFEKYILDTQYEYLYLFDRDEALKKSEDNHILNVNFSRILSKNFLAFIGTKIMFNQYNGLIPYMFNTQTDTTFDNKTYSSMRVGIVYNFPTGKR